MDKDFAVGVICDHYFDWVRKCGTYSIQSGKIRKYNFETHEFEDVKKEINMKCNGCRYWKIIHGSVGECRRNAPQVFKVFLSQNRNDSGNYIGKWPEIVADEMPCGEFEDEYGRTAPCKEVLGWNVLFAKKKLLYLVDVSQETVNVKMGMNGTYAKFMLLLL